MKSIAALVLVLAVATAAGAQSNSSQQQSPAGSLNSSEEVTKQFLDSFKKSGVPTAPGVLAAFENAKQVGSIEAWTEAATISNAYANAVDVLADHYLTRYRASQSLVSGGVRTLLNKAADYEKVRNEYLKRRNEAYLELAKLYLANGEKAMALSFAMTSVSLSGSQQNADGETFILQMIEMDKP